MLERVLREPRSEAGAGSGPLLRRRALIFITFVLTLSRIGAYWDVQWHYAVGRDSFFIPPHDLIYAGVAITGFLGLVMVVLAVLGRGAASFPTGWAIQLVGAIVMVSAAPLDELWHRRYGLDVTIWSPPHMVGVFGAWLMNAGLIVSWAIERRETLDRRWSRIALLGLVWATTLLISMFNFALIPAMRWSVMQPVTPILYSTLASLLIPGAVIALVWITRQPWTALPVAAGLVLLRLLDTPIWAFGLDYVVPLFGQSVRNRDLAVIYRHLWVHPLINGATVLAVVAAIPALRGRFTAWTAAFAGAAAGLAIWGSVMLLATGRYVRVYEFRDRGATGRDFHAETDLLLRVLGGLEDVSPALAALAWALCLGILSGLAGYVVARRLARTSERRPAVAVTSYRGQVAG